MSHNNQNVRIPVKHTCECCGDLLPESVEVWEGHSRLFCPKPACNEAARTCREGRYIVADSVACMAKGCDRFIPEGVYGKAVRVFACSPKCRQAYCYDLRGADTPFVCASCGTEGTGVRNDREGARKYCNRICAGNARYEKTLSKAGRHRPLLDLYLKTGVIERYRGGSVRTHTYAVTNFLKFADLTGIDSLEEVNALTISNFAA